jgi:uncharacterized protein (DUF1330 family)
VNREITLVALLFIDPDRRADFERYESRAAVIMRRHGGAIARRISFSEPTDPSQPDEVHVVTFPDAASFERYRADPDLQALGSLRAAAIRRTVVWRGVEAPGFGEADERSSP